MTLADQLGAEAWGLHLRRLNRERVARHRAHHGNRPRWLPFIGIDGEGGGTDRLGRQHYKLMRAGSIEGSEGELYFGDDPLDTASCLEFLLSLPKAAILVGYFFTYDSTMILRDLPDHKIRRLFEPRPEGQFNGYTYWRDYGIDFRPRQYFRVCRLVSREGKPAVLEGSSRTVNEVGGFFQRSFVEVINDWKIGSAQGRATIAANKAARSSFERIGLEERNYCRLEVKYLARLMTAFREACDSADAMPASWRGAGAIAAALHRDHKTPKREAIEDRRPARHRLYFTAAYYGGRFELTRHGRIAGPVYERDINSAYPAAMPTLPCPLHTRWRPLRELPAGGLYVAEVTFSHPKRFVLANLPFRSTTGHLYWPLAGRGTYWAPELLAAIRAGTRIDRFWGGYAAESSGCTCQPFDWVPALYEARQQLGKQTRGYPLKLGINGLYGKLAQRLGGAPYRDIAAAGIITAATRAKLIDAYATLPPGDRSAILMMATDSIFSTCHLEVDTGPGLGQWEEKTRPTGLFMVQPGIYWSPGSDQLPKTRGVPRSRIIASKAEFEAAWEHGFEHVAVPVTNFIGHRLAQAWGDPSAAGRWITAPREISFDWTSKRRADAVIRDGAAWSRPIEGHRAIKSQAYNPKLITELELQAIEAEAGPDHVHWGNTGE